MYRLLATLIIALYGPSSSAQTTKTMAPGAPGKDAHWPSAAKNGFGTANTLTSKVWFTLAEGVLTEVFYPRLDVPNVQTLQFIVVSPAGVEREGADTIHNLQVLDSRSPTFRQINTARNGAYTITKTYTADPRRPSILVDVRFVTRNDIPYALYAYYDPSLNNSGMHDTAWSEGQALVAADSSIASALVVNSGLDEMTNGFLGSSDGLMQLEDAARTIKQYAAAKNGNVVQVARIHHPKTFTLALAFGTNAQDALRHARASLARGFDRTLREYKAGWHGYVTTLAHVEAKYQRQFDMSAVVLKALEDKTYRGAIIASPSIPWGGGPNGNEATISGYHGVWSRDLYQVATALYAIGDKATAKRALDFLFRVQQKSDGSFPQNSWVDGQPIGGGLQMDEVAFPIILALQLRRTDRATWLKHVKPAADFIVGNGPATDQDRWEEKRGYSPATIAAEIAALVCAARIARVHGDELSAGVYLKTADDWARNVESWTATTSGPHAHGRYYLRITANKSADEGRKLEINSGGGSYDEREIVDAGFLELVRLGIKAADDPLIRKSLALVDTLIQVDTPVGAAWYRYNHDAYGERSDGKPYDGKTGVGRLWTLLTGERGEYELALHDGASARKRLDAMMTSANDGMMIPEQLWDRSESPGSAFRFGSGTGSATPLAWSMAQFIRLAINIRSGRNVETPSIVAVRYLKRS
jgi:glucoamylase